MVVGRIRIQIYYRKTTILPTIKHVLILAYNFKTLLHPIDTFEGATVIF